MKRISSAEPALIMSGNSNWALFLMPHKLEPAFNHVLRARCSIELRRRLERYLKGSGRKESDVLRDAVTQYLDREEPELHERVKHRVPLSADTFEADLNANRLKGARETKAPEE